MIKIFDTKASYDAASKSQTESDLSLVKANNTAYVDGTNVCISQPKVGDIQIQKDDSSISYISLDTYKSGAFPSGWTTLGVVAARSVYVLPVVSPGRDDSFLISLIPPDPRLFSAHKND